MTRPQPDTEELLDRAGQGDRSARENLLARHRPRLRRMVAAHLDRRLAARVDPSDVVQEVLAAADQGLSDYIRDRPVSFYPWLRQMAWDKLIEVHRKHIRAKKRSVTREVPLSQGLSAESALELAKKLLASGTSPSHQLLRQELHERIQQAMEQLAEPDREILLLRHTEQLSTKEIAEILRIGEGAVKMRHLRALQRLRALLEEETPEDEPWAPPLTRPITPPPPTPGWLS